MWFESESSYYNVLMPTEICEDIKDRIIAILILLRAKIGDELMAEVIPAIGEIRFVNGEVQIITGWKIEKRYMSALYGCFTLLKSEGFDSLEYYEKCCFR